MLLILLLIYSIMVEYTISYAIENPILMEYPIGNSIEYTIESHGIFYSKMQ